MSSEQLEISQSNFETLIKDSKETFLNSFLKIHTFVHSQIAISRYCILITNFLIIQNTYTEHFQTFKTEYFAKILNV